MFFLKICYALQDLHGHKVPVTNHGLAETDDLANDNSVPYGKF